ncbi:DUF21 domain-containing protein, partial [bacterium]|nr:DUF21 domain-containing protein [bacterium]
MLIYIFVILISLSLKSFFTCAEMSLISSNKFKLHFLASEGNVLAQKALKLLAKPQLYLSTTLVGNNLSLIIASAVVSRLISQTVPEQWVNLATSTIMLPATLFLTELIPMSIGRLNATRLSLNLIRPLYYALYILYPFVKGFSFLSEKVVRLLGLKINEAQPFPSRDEIQHILESE